MAELDADGSGEIDFTEFSAWWQRWAQQRTSAKQRSGLDGVISEIVADVASVSERGLPHRRTNLHCHVDIMFVLPHASCRKLKNQRPQVAAPSLTNKSWN